MGGVLFHLFLLLFKRVCHQATSLIPVLLFRLGKEKNPCVTHAVLNCLPNLGAHKVLKNSIFYMSNKYKDQIGQE